MKKTRTILLFTMLFTALGAYSQKTAHPMTFHQLVGAGARSEVVNQLKKGVDPNCIINEGVTPVMTAAVYNQPEIIELLFSFKANLNLQTSSGWTAVLYASENGSNEALEMLIK